MADPSTPHEVGSAWEPWHIALARRVTRGDPKFMELVRGDHPLEKPPKFAFDRLRDLGQPYVLAAFLVHRMWEPNDDGRLQWLKDEIGNAWLWQNQNDLLASDPRQHAVDFLKKRFHEERAAMLKEGMAGQIQMYLAPVDLSRSDEEHNEDFIQELRQSRVPETAYFHDDGLLHQSPTSTAAWRCYGVTAEACASGASASVGSGSERAEVEQIVAAPENVAKRPNGSDATVAVCCRTPKRSRKNGYKTQEVIRAFNRLIKEGKQSKEELLVVGPKRFMETLRPEMKGPIPDITVFGKVYRTLRQDHGLGHP